MPSRALPLVLLAALGLSGCLSAGTVAPASLVQQLVIDKKTALSLANDFRAANGLKPLEVSPQLEVAAGQQSEAMARADRMDHEVAGALPGRTERAGYHWGTVAENIGRGYGDYAAAMRGWIDSPGHRRNLLNPRVTEIGFAGRRIGPDGTPYWTQILAAPSQRAAVRADGKPLRWGPERRFP